MENSNSSNAIIKLREPLKQIIPTFGRQEPGHFPDEVEPFAIADDLFFIGRVDTGCLALKTTEGIVLIDAINPENAASQYILPGLKKLGFGNEKVLACFITHGHGDHYGGAAELREKTGCKIYLNEADLPTMTAPDSRGNYHPYPDPIDVFVNDGDEFTFGDKTILAVLTPGHTPGCLSFIFPVKDNGEAHVACIWGGTGMPLPNTENVPLAISDYIKSAVYFSQLCLKMGVDIEVSAHPFVDNCVENGKIRSALKAGEQNPFIIGSKGVADFMYQRIITGMTELAKYVNKM